MKKLLLLTLLGLFCTWGTTTRAANSDPFYGYMVYSDTEPDLGVFKITPPQTFSLSCIDPYDELGFDLIPNNGWYVDGILNGVSLWYMDAYTPVFYFSYSLNLATGELLDYTEYNNWMTYDSVFDICTLNPDDGLIYGYALDINSSPWQYYWAWASPDNITDIHHIKPADTDDHFMALCYHPDEQIFYGITADFIFASIDTQGNIDYIKPLPYFEDAAFVRLQSGLIWDPATDLFYWNAQIYDPLFEIIGGFLSTISTDGVYEHGPQLYGNPQFSFFYTPEVYVNPARPLMPQIKNVEFADGSLQGTMTVEIPSTYGSGQPLPSNLTYTALLDNNVYKTGSATPGQTLTVDYTLQEFGNYILGISVSAGNETSKVASYPLYVGFDTPLAPQNVILSPTQVTWQPVTAGVNNGYLDPKAVTYQVSINDEVVATVSTTSCTVDLLDNGALKRYTATVKAMAGGQVSAPATSNTIVAGTPVSLPISYTPTESEFENMTVFNADNDEYDQEGYYGSKEITWELCPYGLFSGGTEWRTDYMNDYIFLPPVYLTTGEDKYNLAFDSGLYNDYFTDEYLNVVYATSPIEDGVEDAILSNYTPTAYLAAADNKFTEWDRVSVPFSVPKDGVYYIGFQCVSDPWMFGIYIRNINLTTTAGVKEFGDKAKVDVRGEKGAIIVNNVAGEKVQVVSLDGRVIYSATTLADSLEIPVMPGVYVVKTSTGSAKVFVK